MATLRNKKKLAAVSRETPEITSNSQSQNTLDTEMAEEYIFQVFEEIEERVTKKLFFRYLQKLQQFSRMESRVLGALSRLDEFLLNPQVRTCSVAVPRTSRNGGDSGNREPNGDRSSNDPCPEAMVSSHHSGNLIGSELEEYPHMLTGGPEDFRNRPHKVTGGPEEIRNRPPIVTGQEFKKRFPTAPLELRQEGKKRHASQVSHNFAVKAPLRQLKQTTYCLPLNSWRRTVIQPISRTTKTECRNSLNPSHRLCPH